MEDLCHCVRTMWSHESIQVEGIVRSGQLSVCAQMLSKGLTQKNQK